METQPIKIDSAVPENGAEGQQYLATTERVGMRLWKNEQPGARKAAVERNYDTVGYVISGAAELHIDGRMIALRAGDSWRVPAGVMHAYRILETLTAVEATSPPARFAGRDD
jgi:mannose-6-phosphate isomerase-like protein (cupin superfamily)